MLWPHTKNTRSFRQTTTSKKTTENLNQPEYISSMFANDDLSRLDITSFLHKLNICC
jgi:hypothetical protein